MADLPSFYRNKSIASKTGCITSSAVKSAKEAFYNPSVMSRRRG